MSRRKHRMMTKWLALDPKGKLIISSLLTLQHLLHSLNCTRNAMSYVLLLPMMVCVCVCLCGVRIWFLLGYVVFVVEFLSCAFVFCSLLFSVPLFRWLEDDGCCVASLFLLYLPCLWFVQLGVTAACKLSVILHKKKTNNK